MGSGFPPAMLFGSGSSMTGVGKAGGACSGGVDVRFLLSPDRAEARAGNFRFRSIFPLTLANSTIVNFEFVKDASWYMRRKEEISVKRKDEVRVVSRLSGHWRK